MTEEENDIIDDVIIVLDKIVDATLSGTKTTSTTFRRQKVSSFGDKIGIKETESSTIGTKKLINIDIDHSNEGVSKTLSFNFANQSIDINITDFGINADLTLFGANLKGGVNLNEGFLLGGGTKGPFNTSSTTVYMRPGGGTAIVVGAVIVAGLTDGIALPAYLEGVGAATLIPVLLP